MAVGGRQAADAALVDSPHRAVVTSNEIVRFEHTDERKSFDTCDWTSGMLSASRRAGGELLLLQLLLGHALGRMVDAVATLRVVLAFAAPRWMWASVLASVKAFSLHVTPISRGRCRIKGQRLTGLDESCN